MSERQIDVICPVYREAEGIAAFHAELAAVLLELAGRYRTRVLYVMDPSTDETEARLAEICASDPQVTTLVLSRRFGHQAALVAGLEHSHGDAAVMLDSDGQHPPEVILDLVAAFEAGADVAQAVRQDAPKTGWFKRTTSEAFYKLMSRLASIDLRVGSADFRLLSRRVVDVFRDQLPERNPFIRGLTSWVGFTVAYVGFTSRDRTTGASNYSLRLLIEFAATGITSFSKFPLRAAAGLGVVMSGVSALYGFIAIGAYFTQQFVAPGWTSLLAVIAFIGGLQLLFLGVIAEYVGQIFDEVKGRPRYLVAKTIGGPWIHRPRRPSRTSMLSEETSPDALRGPVVLVVMLFLAYTMLSVVGIVLVKKWLPEAQTNVSAGRLNSAAVWWSVLGAAAYISSFLLWLGLLTRAPLSVAYPVAVGATLCLTLVASLWIFKERPTAIQLVGSALVLLGITLIGSGLRR